MDNLMEDKGKSHWVSGICGFPKNTIFGRRSWTSKVWDYLFDPNSHAKTISKSGYNLRHKPQQNGRNMESSDDKGTNTDIDCIEDEVQTENL